MEQTMMNFFIQKPKSQIIHHLPPPSCIILENMGQGQGQSCSLYSKLCGINSKDLGKIDILINTVKCGQSSIRLISITDIENPIIYKTMIRGALTLCPISTIFVVLKYEEQCERLLERYLEQQKLVYKYDHKIVVLISNWELSKDPKNDLKKICEIFGEDDICSNIICYPNNCNYDNLNEIMYSCASLMTSETLEIPNEDIFTKHNIPLIKQKIFKLYKESKKEVELTIKDYRSSLSELPTSDRDEVLRILMVQLKYDFDGILHNFNKNAGELMHEIEFYGFSTKIQKENENYYNGFVQMVKSLMTYDMFDNKDPRNLIKRCPYCQTIWIKTEGCEGITTCGNKSFSNYYDISTKPWFGYTVNRIKGEKIILKKDSEKPKISLHKAIESTNKVGCGKEITWNALPPIEDSLILELFKI